MDHDCVLSHLYHVVAYHGRESIIYLLGKLLVVDGQLDKIDVSYGVHISSGFLIAKLYVSFWNIMDQSQ